MASNMDLPEDDYECEILDMQAKRHPEGWPMVVWPLKVVGGPCDGQKTEKKYHLKSDESKARLKKDLKMVGVDAPTQVEFEKNKHHGIGKRIKISAVLNDAGFTSLYLKGVVNPNDPPTPPEDVPLW